MNKIIYCDHAATTPLSASVMHAMQEHLSTYGNPSSLHGVGRQAKKTIDESRTAIARSFGALDNEIYFTSSGTEANNWAIRGVAYSQITKGKNHIITTSIEHPSILNTCKRLEAEGFEATYLPVDSDGYVNVQQVKDAIQPNTFLVSVMLANNEIGTIQPIKEIGAVCKNAGVLFHIDAVQAVGNIEINVNEFCVDLMSVSGHKIHALKGVGLLYIRQGVELENLIDGGGQESGRRSGTENTLGIIALKQAITDATNNIRERCERVALLRDYLINSVLVKIPNSRLNGGTKKRLPGNANFSFDGVEGESLVLMLDNDGICVSAGSACASGSLEPSHVLTAIGLPVELAYGSIRVSIDESITIEDINCVVEKLCVTVERLRAMNLVALQNNNFTIKQRID
jgi:cysteine desulfurase